MLGRNMVLVENDEGVMEWHDLDADDGGGELHGEYAVNYQQEQYDTIFNSAAAQTSRGAPPTTRDAQGRLNYGTALLAPDPEMYAWSRTYGLWNSQGTGIYHMQQYSGAWEAYKVDILGRRFMRVGAAQPEPIYAEKGISAPYHPLYGYIMPDDIYIKLRLAANAADMSFLDSLADFGPIILIAVFVIYIVGPALAATAAAAESGAGTAALEAAKTLGDIYKGINYVKSAVDFAENGGVLAGASLLLKGIGFVGGAADMLGASDVTDTLSEAVDASEILTEVADLEFAATAAAEAAATADAAAQAAAAAAEAAQNLPVEAPVFDDWDFDDDYFDPGEFDPGEFDFGDIDYGDIDPGDIGDIGDVGDGVDFGDVGGGDDIWDTGNGDITDTVNPDEIDMTDWTDQQYDDYYDEVMQPVDELETAPVTDEEIFENNTVEEDWGAEPEYTDEQLLEQQYNNSLKDLSKLKPQQLKQLAQSNQKTGVKTPAGTKTYPQTATGYAQALKDVYTQYGKTATPAQQRALAAATGLPPGTRLTPDGKIVGTGFMESGGSMLPLLALAGAILIT